MLQINQRYTSISHNHENTSIVSQNPFYMCDGWGLSDVWMGRVGADRWARPIAHWLAVVTRARAGERGHELLCYRFIKYCYETVYWSSGSWQYDSNTFQKKFNKPSLLKSASSQKFANLSISIDTLMFMCLHEFRIHWFANNWNIAPIELAVKYQYKDLLMFFVLLR